MNYIHPTALIGPNVEMGDNNYIGPYCVIGYPAEHLNYWPKLVYEKDEFSGFIEMIDEAASNSFPFSKKDIGRVTIGNNNVFTGFCTVDAGTVIETSVGNDCFIMKRAHIGHDSTVCNNVIISPNCIVGGHVRVMDGANLGQSVCTHQYTVIGAYSMLGIGSVVPKSKNVEPFQMYAGNPIHHMGENKKMAHMVSLKYLEQYNELLKIRHES